MAQNFPVDIFASVGKVDQVFAVENFEEVPNVFHIYGAKSMVDDQNVVQINRGIHKLVALQNESPIIRRLGIYTLKKYCRAKNKLIFGMFSRYFGSILGCRHSLVVLEV